MTPYLRLVHFPVNAAFAFVMGRVPATMRTYRLHTDEPLFFQTRKEAVSAAKRNGFIVKRNGIVETKPLGTA